MQRSSRSTWVSGNSKRTSRLILTAVAALVLIMLATACGPPAPSVPTDAQDACSLEGQPLTPAMFASWFHTGSVSLNGVVDPANSLLSLTPNCGFYQWSERMFMWLTSPAPATYGGGGGLIVDSPTFYDVSPPDASGNRTFIPHTPGLIRAFPLRAAQVGPHGLQVILTSSRQLIEVKPPEPNVRLLVRDPSGKLVEIAHARLENGRPILLDREGKVIAAQHVASLRPARETNALIAQKFLIDGIPIFLDPSLDVIDVEQGQATFGGPPPVLEAQITANGSLVYYATMVNDVYAYFLTGVKDGAITTTTPNQFPTTQSDIQNTINFATGHGKPSPPFPDVGPNLSDPNNPNAMAIEVKSAWVVAAGLPNLSSYITMNATIPVYSPPAPPPSGTTTMTATGGQQTVQLAMVGMHVVGSTAGHPEMVWATFEHVGNTPLATYSYSSTSGAKTVSQSTSGTWLFSANGSAGPFNVAHMFFTGPPSNNIQSATGFTIAPSDTLRSEPWGIDGSNAGSNTEVISTNHTVLTDMTSGDIRGNYIMTGATWTAGGGPPSFVAQVGTNQLTNTTMETYQQGTNCFNCHLDPPMRGALSPGPSPTGIGLSHIFGGIEPLF